MIRKIGILILVGIISMYTVIPMALADNENPACSITVEEPPTCEDGVVFTLDATVTGGTLPYNYSWSDGGVGGTFSDPTAKDPTWTPPAGFTGTVIFTLEVTDDNECLTECYLEVTEIEDEENIFTIIWDKLTSMLSFFENEEEETTFDVEEEHPSGKVNHGAIVSLIAKIINKSKSVVGKTHGLIMRTVAKTNWGKKIEEKDISDEENDKGKKPDIIPVKKGLKEHPKKSKWVLETVFKKIILTLSVKQNAILKNVKDKVADEAEEAIQRAIENNERKIARMEKIREHVLERVKNRNSNNE